VGEAFMSSSSLAAALRCLRAKLARQQLNEDCDEQLLYAFTTRRDDSAFAVLVRRHGPMVLDVCRRVLGHPQDAEDAFQATFLVLARNAASLRNKTALASWLHGIASRTALKAKQAAARRRKHEGQTPVRPPTNSSDELLCREARALLDEEIARLPKAFRRIFVLCCLENMSQAEVGRRLGLKQRTVSNRLTEARKRLARRLSCRGVELSAVLAAVALATPPATAVAAGLTAKTVEAASAAAAGAYLLGLVSPSVVEMAQPTTAMLTSKTKIMMLLLLATTVLAGAGAWTVSTSRLRLRAGTPLSPSVSKPQPSQAKKSAAPLQRKDDSVTVTGRVLDPDGKPLVGAQVYVDPQTQDAKPTTSATAGKHGRFSLTLHRSRLLDPETKCPLQHVRILATAKGYGLDWQEVPLPLTLSPKRKEQGDGVALRLVKDDVPIQGRILSLEGKPLAGIKVYIKAIEAFPRGDLDRALDAQRKGNQIINSTEVHFLWYRYHLPNPSLMATTGADGRFRLEGIGRERIVTFDLEGPGIHYASMQAMTQRAKSVHGPYKSSMIYGANFDYLVKPSRLIRGTVREKDSGKALVGIRIYGMGFTDSVTAETVTDNQGRYELPGCPKDDKYGLMASPMRGAPYFHSKIVLQDTPGLGPLTADLELTRGIPCEGKVLDGETGQAVPGEIRYSPLWPNPNVPEDLGVGRISIVPVSTATIGADGTYRCVVLPGCGCLAFRANEPNRYQQACVDPSTIQASGDKRFLNLCNGAGGNGLLDQEMYQAIQLIKPSKDVKKVSEALRLTVTRHVLGQVQDGDGKPLEGVRVRGLERWGSWKTLPGEQFIVRGVNPLRPRRLYFVHDARRLIGNMAVKGTETKPLTVRLQPWVAVGGRLVDTEGHPLRNAKVSGSEFVMEDGRTDDQGRFRLEGLIPGLRYDLYYAKNISAVFDTMLKEFVGKPGEVRDLGDVRIKPSPQE
jgi:RNA polymerase sigma factor (sigma-70 family)